MKKILILTVTAGNGHNACANGMKAKLEKLPGVEVKIIDLLKEYSTKLNVWTADKGYNIAVSRLLPLYNAFYKHYKKAEPDKRYSCTTQDLVVSTLDGLLKEILIFQPDVIYSTHFYGAIAVTDLKLMFNLPCKTIVSNLDYVNSPFWEAGIGIDYFVIPNEDFIAECEWEGYNRAQLLPMGLPVDSRTMEVVDKKEARRQLGLAEDVFTIMIMFGGGHWGGGYKIFKQVIKSLKGRKAQVIMINGRNKESFKKIENTKFDENIKVLNVGFTRDVPLYLSAADLILNKFGGTSVTEMINKGLPMLITENAPMQEIYNLVYMKEKGVAMSFKTMKELDERLNFLIDNPKVLNQMAEKTKALKRDTLNELSQFMVNQPKADYKELLSQKIDFKNLKRDIRKKLRLADKQEKTKIRLKRQGVKV